MRKWICLPCVTPHSGGDVHHDAAAVVEAETAEAAASAAHHVMADEDPNLDPDYTSSMFVMPFEPEDFIAMRRGVAFTRAADEWQCCGGPIGLTADGHSGYCPNRKEDQ